MGFRSGAYAKVWEVKPKSNSLTVIRVSINRKNKLSGEYEQEFSGYVSCIGSAAANNALALKKGDSIKLGDCDVCTSYNKETKVTYTNYKLFSFESSNQGGHPADEPVQNVDYGELDDSGKELPF